jgi:hypothetical protein
MKQKHGNDHVHPLFGEIFDNLYGYRSPQGERVVSGVHDHTPEPQPDFDAMRRAILAGGGTSMISNPDEWMASYQALFHSIDPRTLMVIADAIDKPDTGIHEVADFAERLRMMARQQFAALSKPTGSEK